MTATPTTPALSDEGLASAIAKALAISHGLKPERAEKLEHLKPWMRDGSTAASVILATRPPVKGDSVELVERVASLARAATALSERVVVLEGAANTALAFLISQRAEGKGPTNAECELRLALKGCDVLGGDK